MWRVQGYDRRTGWAIVGTGGIARAHGLACQALDDVDLCAICDVSEAALHRYGDGFAVSRRYPDLDEMLAAEEPGRGHCLHLGHRPR